MIVDPLREAEARECATEERYRAVLDTLREVVVETRAFRLDAERRLRRHALYDELTGLPNRRLVVERLEETLRAGGGSRPRVAVLFLDLDHFKVINDSLGHVAGDSVLMEVAMRVLNSVRPDDTVGRLGGDEFVCICEDVDDPKVAYQIAARIQSSLRRPLVLAKGELVVRASVGIAMAEADSDAGTLIRDADNAMYRAKERGRDAIALFDDAMRTKAVERLRTESLLRDAIDRGRFTVLYQPVVELGTRRVVAVEALLRIESADGKILPPAAFIEVAEDTGLIVTLGMGVLDAAARQAANWQKRFGAFAPDVAINLSARQLGRPNLAADVLRALDVSGVDPRAIALEITESVLMEASPSTMQDLLRLKETGLKLGIDDFGTGYSSLTYLKALPIDFLKVDRTFVSGLGTNRDDQAIVGAVLNLAKALGLTTVGEGVETEVQEEQLRAMGCDRAQGYLFGKPTAADVITSMIVAQVNQPRPAFR